MIDANIATYGENFTPAEEREKNSWLLKKIKIQALAAEKTATQQMSLEAIKINHADNIARNNASSGPSTGSGRNPNETFNLKTNHKAPGWQPNLPYDIYKQQVLNWNTHNKNYEYSKFTELIESLKANKECKDVQQYVTTYILPSIYSKN